MKHRVRTVSEVAEVAHVTVRTLHHYDEIGLLTPSERSEAGYRLYTDEDLERLQQILLHRELGFSLDAIGGLLDEPGIDRLAALKAQRRSLLERRQRLDAIIRSVERTLGAMEKGTEMKTEEMFEGFEDLPEAPEAIRDHHREHAAEAHDRWGRTREYEESMRRAKSYGKPDWEAIQSETEENEARMAELLARGADPASAEAREAAEAMRRHIDRWFYPCSPAMHVGLAAMYEEDPRFREHYDQRAEGLAEFVARAIRANAASAS